VEGSFEERRVCSDGGNEKHLKMFNIRIKLLPLKLFVKYIPLKQQIKHRQENNLEGPISNMILRK